MFGTGSSIPLVRVFGIRIGASPSWFIVLFFFIYFGANWFQDWLGGSSTQAYVVSVCAVFLFFVSLVMHELGHALVARRNGIGISGIDLWFFGGVAKMTRDTDSPGVEFKVAAAGPLVTLGVVLFCAALAAAVSNGAALDVARFDEDAVVTPILALLGFLIAMNAFLFLFNLIPAFPLDGGRIARALIWKVTGNRHRATRIAGRMGEWLSYGLVAFGVFLALNGALTDGLWLGVLGLLLAQSARAAVISTAFTERLEGVTVADIMDAHPVAMPASTPLTEAEEQYFMRYGWDWFPVVDERGVFLGTAQRQRMEAEFAAGRPVLAVGEIVERGDAEAWRVRSDSPLEALLGDEHLRARGALMAVDADGILRGVVTIEQVRRAVSAAMPQRLA